MFSLLCTTLYIVGDQFAAFATNEGVCTISDFIALLAAGGLQQAQDLTVITGQGVDESEAQALREQLTRAGLDQQIHLALPAGAIETHYAHKRLPENVLIAQLHRSSPEQYRAALRLAGRNEMLMDHTTGQHVQGMITIEAARQMMIAVTERFVRPGLGLGPSGYVMAGISTTFERYLFPVDAELHMRFDSMDLTRPQRSSFVATVEVLQGGILCGTCTARYKLMPEAVIRRTEAALARQAAQRANANGPAAAGTHEATSSRDERPDLLQPARRTLVKSTGPTPNLGVVAPQRVEAPVEV